MQCARLIQPTMPGEAENNNLPVGKNHSKHPFKPGGKMGKQGSRFLRLACRVDRTKYNLIEVNT
jgi:hypothetical protein